MKTKTEIENRLDKLEEYVSIEMDNIRKLAEQKPIFKDLFSITTYSDVCKELKEKEETCPYKMIKQIEKLFNVNWVKDWDNKNQSKWYPYYEQTGSGLVFRSSHSFYFGFAGQVAFYKDKKTSDHIGKYFIDVYKKLM
jgi:hypothetical protein